MDWRNSWRFISRDILLSNLGLYTKKLEISSTSYYSNSTGVDVQNVQINLLSVHGRLKSNLQLGQDELL